MESNKITIFLYKVTGVNWNGMEEDSKIIYYSSPSESTQDRIDYLDIKYTLSRNNYICISKFEIITYIRNYKINSILND